MILLFPLVGGKEGLLFAAGPSEYPDSVLYEAYLHNDMKVWKAYIDATDWNSISPKERLRLLKYEYGYVATQIDALNGVSKSERRQLQRQPEHYLGLYERHLEEMKSALAPAQYAAYQSAANAYEFMLDKSKLFTAGLRSFQLAKQAVELDANDPFALTLKANVDFYAPRAVGGNKQHALERYLKAREHMQSLGMTTCNWCYTAIWLCIAQCYEKTDRIDQAIAEARQLLKSNPEFEYVRDTYLPYLISKKNKK